MRHKILKAISMLVVFFFAWTAGGLFNVAYAAYNETQNPPVNSRQEQRPEEKFQQAIEDIKNIIQDKAVSNENKGIRSKISAVFETKKSRLKAKRGEIESFDNSIRSQFADTEKKLIQAGLPAEILQRHHNFVKHYEDNIKELRINLDAADKAKTKAEFDTRIQKVQQHLDKVAPPRKHKALDPNKLPHRVSNLKRKEPRTRPEDFKRDLKQTAEIDSSRERSRPFPTLNVIPLADDLQVTKTGIQPSLSLRANAESAAIPTSVIPDRHTPDYTPAGIQPASVIPVQTGIQEKINNNQPILLAANGPLTGLVETLPKFEEQKNLPQPLFSKEGSNPETDFNSLNSPPFLKGERGGFSSNITEPIILAQAANPPTAADLAETIDVQLTPAIKAKAQELNYSPVKIYNWVRNNVEYVPTYGSIQGADMCLQTKQGNDFDIASLLIALLRASNIPARYVQGTIELPIDKVMNWVGGFTDANAALNFIASGGTPVAGIITGGKISSVRMEHVWVEAYINYYPLRGAAHKTGKGDTWIPLDASYKQYTYKAGMDLYSSLAFDGEQFMAAYVTDAQDITPYQFYGKQVIAWLDNNYPNSTIEDIIGAETIPLAKVIIAQEFSYLLGTLPYRSAIKGTTYSEIPASMRHKVNVKVIDATMYDESINFSKSLPELSGKRITLSYEPATSDDEALINQYGGNILAVPPYLLNVKPVIKVEGAIVATGNSIGMGGSQALNITFTTLGNGDDVIKSDLIVGTYSGITIQPQTTTADNLADRMEKLRNNSKNIDAVSLDDLLGELLSNIGISYFHHLTLEDNFYAKTFQIAHAKKVSAAVTTLDINIKYLFGIPHGLTQGGTKIDVRRNVHISASLSGDMNRNKQFMLIAGMTASTWENKIFEVFFNTPSVSAMKLLKYANQQGIQIHTINSSNISQVLPILQISSDVKIDIQNAINAGKKVIITQKELQYYEWKGVGYVVLDPLQGTGAYMISGGLAGGGTAKVLESPPVTMGKKSLEYKAIKPVFQYNMVIGAYAWIGTLYQFGRKGFPYAGIDCSGLTKLVVAGAGYKIPDGSMNQYDYFQNNGMLFQTPQTGDLFFWQKDGKVYHTGIVVDVKGEIVTVIHAVTLGLYGDKYNEVTAEDYNMTDSEYTSHIVGYGRIIE